MEMATRQGIRFEGSTTYIRGTIDLIVGPSLARKRKARRSCRERAKQMLARLRRTKPAARTVEAPDMRDGDIPTSGASSDADAMVMATSSTGVAITDGMLVKVVSGRHLGLTGVARGRVSRSTVAVAVELPDPSQLRNLMVALDQLEVAARGPAKARQCIAKAASKAPMHLNRKRLWHSIPGMTEDDSQCSAEAQQHTSEMEREIQTPTTLSTKPTAIRSQHVRRGSVAKDSSPYPTAWGSKNCGVVRSSFKAINKGLEFGGVSCGTEGRSDDDMGDTGTDCVTPGPSLGSEYGAGHSVEMEGVTPDRPRSGSFSSLYSDWSSDSDIEEGSGDVGGGDDAVFEGGSSCEEVLREGPRRLSVDGSGDLEHGQSQQLEQRVLRSASVKGPSLFISRCLSGVARGSKCSSSTRPKGFRGRAMVVQSGIGTRWRRPRPPPLSLELDDVDTEKQVCGLINATKIMENLWVSGQEATTDKASLQREGVTHIVNCSLRLPDFYPKDFFYHRVRWADECGQDVDPEVLKKAFSHIDAARSAGKACLVHCQAGMSRSCALVMGYLMQLGQGMSLAAAFELCQSKRPQCFPDKYFMQKLSEFEESLFGQTSVRLEKYCRGDDAHSILIEND